MSFLKMSATLEFQNDICQTFLNLEIKENASLNKSEIVKNKIFLYLQYFSINREYARNRTVHYRFSRLQVQSLARTIVGTITDDHTGKKLKAKLTSYFILQRVWAQRHIKNLSKILSCTFFYSTYLFS